MVHSTRKLQAAASTVKANFPSDAAHMTDTHLYRASTLAVSSRRNAHTCGIWLAAVVEPLRSSRAGLSSAVRQEDASNAGSSTAEDTPQESDNVEHRNGDPASCDSDHNLTGITPHVDD